jgi:PAS domain S-box-containing protein
MTATSGRDDAALASLAARLEALLNHAPLIFFVVDPEGKITYSAGKGVESLGRRSGESVGQSMFKLYRDVPWIINAVRRALDGETVFVTGDIQGIWFEVHYIPQRASDGVVQEVVGFATEITERKRADEALLRSERRYREVIDSINGIGGSWTSPLSSSPSSASKPSQCSDIPSNNGASRTSG